MKLTNILLSKKNSKRIQHNNSNIQSDKLPKGLTFNDIKTLKNLSGIPSNILNKITSMKKSFDKKKKTKRLDYASKDNKNGRGEGHKKGLQIPSTDKGSRFRSFLGLTLYSIYPDDSKPYTRDELELFCETVISVYTHLVKNHGITEGSRRFKQHSAYLCAIAEGKDPEPMPWVATEGDPALPIKYRAIWPLILDIRNRKEEWMNSLQVLNTIQSIPRLSKEIPELDIGSIIEPFPTEKEKEYKKFLLDYKSFVKDYKFRFQAEGSEELPPIQNRYFVQPRMRMTKGPNGKVTLGSAPLEAKLLTSNATLWPATTRFLEHLGCGELLKYIEGVASCNKQDIDSGYLGKLTLVPDALNKHRLVAMVDYWTNLILAPLEEHIRDILRFTFPLTDYLRNHSEGAKKVMEYTGKAWCTDLSSFTDRFPADLQQPLVEKLLGGNCGMYWRTLVCHRPFWSEKLGRYVKYAVGQPMGSKSSFALASLAHHMFIQFSYSQLDSQVRRSQHIKDSYVLVGDDVVFFNEALAEQCKRNYEIVDIRIQDLKSKVPVTNHLNQVDRFTEFCSRSSVNNIDVSRLSPVLIKNACHSWHNIPALLIHAQERGIELDISLIEEQLTNLSASSPSDDPKLLEEKKAKRLLNVAKLRSILKFPIMGKDLSSFAGKLQTPSLEIGDVEAWQVEQLVYNIQVAQAISSVEEAYDKTTEELKIDSGDCFMWIIQDDIMKHPNGLFPNSILWSNEGAIYHIAQNDAFKVKGWDHDIPHPASVAAAYHIIRATQMKTRGLPGFTEYGDDTSLHDEIYMYLGDLARRTSALDPKGAEHLIVTAKNQGSKYARNQVFIYLNVLLQLAEGRREVEFVYSKGDKSKKTEDKVLYLELPKEKRHNLMNCLSTERQDQPMKETFDLLISPDEAVKRTYMDAAERQRLMEQLENED